MRSIDHQQVHVFSYLSPEERVREDHSLRAVRATTDGILREMSPVFDSMYARCGRPSIAPEELLRVQLLHMLYSVRSERLLIEEIDFGQPRTGKIMPSSKPPSLHAQAFGAMRERHRRTQRMGRSGM